MVKRALDNVIPLRPPGPRPTHCLDCDPDGRQPFRLAYRADVRTGDILTPCPRCGRYALALLPRSAVRLGLGA